MSNQALEPADGLLGLLVRTANRNGTEFPITLTVSGLVMSGVLIGIDSYIAILSANMSQGDIGALDLWRDIADGLRAGIDLDAPPTHIHLRDARFFPAGLQEPIPVWTEVGFAWRGRLAAVSGWAPGVLAVNPG